MYVDLVFMNTKENQHIIQQSSRSYVSGRRAYKTFKGKESQRTVMQCSDATYVDETVIITSLNSAVMHLQHLYVRTSE